MTASHPDKPASEPIDPGAPEVVWQQAAMLLQPALIRVLDQIRRQLEASAWKGNYETREFITPTGEGQILYLFHLTQGEVKAQVNIWELCYQICFQDYLPKLSSDGIRDFQPGEVVTDLSLFDLEGEVDWDRLDAKAQQVVAAMLQGLADQG